ncbi:MAG: hypothetical protein LBP95_02910 [Deltaproteobacteria bacterium]|jgi:hypothetical protein|nr:hypothetical protein [Deltaproteobacteria bacterium]
MSNFASPFDEPPKLPKTSEPAKKNDDRPESGGAQLHCPVCGIMVKLPATECPQCRTNLRTGEKPEEYVPIWKRRKGKLLFLIFLLMLPSVAFSLISAYSEEGFLVFLRQKLGLDSCAEPRDMWEEFSQEEFEQSVKGGYDNWKQSLVNRLAGQSPRGPESEEEAARDPKEKFLEADRQIYFAASLSSRFPSEKLQAQNNWYGRTTGEWDVAYIHLPGSRNEELVAGEWLVYWINDGQAIQDVLSVPYRWQKPPEGFETVQATTVKAFNHAKNYWEGFHVQDDRLHYFRSSRNSSGQIIEQYQVEGGPLVATVFSEMSQTSFRAAVSHSSDNGASYTLIAEIWAKKRLSHARE